MARRTKRIARVVVTLQPHRGHEALIETAGRMAQTLGAELAGRFIKDIDLLNFAALPFTRRFLSHGEMADLDVAMMERLLDEEAQRVRRMLSRRAEESRLRWTFETVTAAVRKALAESTALKDTLVVLETPEEEMWRRIRLTELKAPAASILAVPSTRHIEGPIVAICNSPGAALTTAAEIAEAFREPLRVLFRGQDRSAIDVWLGEHHPDATMEPVSAENVRAVLRRLMPGLVVVERDDTETIEAIEGAGVPVFLAAPAAE